MDALIRLDRLRYDKPRRTEREEHIARGTSHDWRELASRENDGLAIGLYWNEATDRVRVSVVDATAGESFDLDVAGGDALSVFYHPFAYASALRSERSAT
jgi:hypothetical protein